MDLYTIIAVIIFFIGFSFILFADKRQAQRFSQINAKIKEDVNFLSDPVKRQLCESMLSMIIYTGPFTFIEAKKLRKELYK